MKRLFALVFVALLISVLGAGIKKTLYKDYGIVVFHPDSMVVHRAHTTIWGNLYVLSSDSTDTMSMTPDKMTIDSITITDYLHCTDDVQFDSTLTFGSGAVFSQPHADTIILTEGNIILTGKIRAGSFGTPLDVTSNRVYGAELHYYGNNYNVTALRARAQFKTTDATGDTAIGALIQAANNDGINASVLNGAKIEAIGKSTTTGARIGTMRGLLVNTEWSAKDTITDLRILHLRTHTRDATADGCVDGTSYGLYIENEAVGGNGQALDAGIYLDGTNLSAGNKAFTYGADFSGVATDIGTADFRFRSGGLIDNPVDTFRMTEANIDLVGSTLLDDITIDSTFTVECKAVFNDTVMLGDSIDKIILPKGSSIELFDSTDTDKFQIYDDGTNTQITGDNPLKITQAVTIDDGDLIVADGQKLIITDDSEVDSFRFYDNGANAIWYSDNTIGLYVAGAARYWLSSTEIKPQDNATYELGVYNKQWNEVWSREFTGTDDTEADTFRFYDDGSSTIFTTDNDFVLSDDVTLGDTINTVFLPKGTRLILADSSGADSTIFHNDGTRLSISSDNKIQFVDGQNVWILGGDTLYFVGSSLADTVSFAMGSSFFNINSDLPIKISPERLELDGHLYGQADVGVIHWDGHTWHIDADGDDSLAVIQWFATDSLRADTISSQLEWTGTGGMGADVMVSTVCDTVASAATITLGNYNNFVITGTANMDSIDTAGAFPNWGIAYIQFTGIASANGLTDGKNLKLAGNFAHNADDMIVLQRRGDIFYEVSRSVN